MYPVSLTVTAGGKHHIPMTWKGKADKEYEWICVFSLNAQEPPKLIDFNCIQAHNYSFKTGSEIIN